MDINSKFMRFLYVFIWILGILILFSAFRGISQFDMYGRLALGGLVVLIMTPFVAPETCAAFLNRLVQLVELVFVKTTILSARIKNITKKKRRIVDEADFVKPERF